VLISTNRPAADGDFVRQVPELEMASGMYDQAIEYTHVLMIAGNIAPGIESIINSHVIDEGQMFVPAKVEEKDITAVINHYFGTSPATAAAITKRYAPIPDLKARIKSLFQFSTFTCHSRFISEGFKGKTYNLQYARGSGFHGSDINTDFYNKDTQSFLSTLMDPTFGTFATTFQTYLLSHARTGDPNKLREKGSIEWPLVNWGPVLGNVLNATDKGFELISDQVTKAEDCDLWRDVVAGMTSSLGKRNVCFLERVMLILSRLFASGSSRSVQHRCGWKQPVCQFLRILSFTNADKYNTLKF
jgi:hypothetical protein